jgi:CspA family cold shock protein
VVVAFDAHVGRGVVRASTESGAGRDYGFHCVQIADGTRTIAVGTAVEFEIIPGPLGRWEAANLRPASSAS